MCVHGKEERYFAPCGKLIKFDSVAAALRKMKMRQAENKLDVHKWLAEIGIASKNLLFASFLHVPLRWPYCRMCGLTNCGSRCISC